MSWVGVARAIRRATSLRRAMRCLAMYLSWGEVLVELVRELEGEGTYAPAVHGEDADCGGVGGGGHCGGLCGGFGGWLGGGVGGWWS